MAAESLWGHSAGAPAGAAGVPGEGDCTDCHTGTVNSGGGRVQVSLVNAVNWTPGTPVTVRITLSDPSAQRWGFEITARSASNPVVPLGTLAVIDSANTQLTIGGNLQFITHRTAGTRPGTSASSTWDVRWTPPASAGAGDVTFFVAGNAANNSGTEAGDHIYTTSLTAAAGAPTTGTPKVLPQLAFGSQAGAGAWYTAVYVHNTTGSPVQVPVDFFGADGSALNISGIGTTTTVSLSAKGTGIVEIPNVGPLTQGWIQATLPDGVIGYGIFRQSVSGNSDQEGTVPFSSTTSTGATLVFDETAFDTAVSVLNPSSVNVTVTITARDDKGAVLGVSTLALGAKRREAFVLKSRPELTTMQGKRGSVDFSVSSGAVAVLGLRFKGLSFTSILPTER
ncbi:MAG: hypothetical protein HY821_25815 [Acidobacteria bacterium]|nr:hypothetical protein [Acidobacteriota bacterium]